MSMTAHLWAIKHRMTCYGTIPKHALGRIERWWRKRGYRVHVVGEGRKEKSVVVHFYCGSLEGDPRQ